MVIYRSTVVLFLRPIKSTKLGFRKRNYISFSANSVDVVLNKSSLRLLQKKKKNEGYLTLTVIKELHNKRSTNTASSRIVTGMLRLEKFPYGEGTYLLIDSLNAIKPQNPVDD